MIKIGKRSLVLFISTLWTCLVILTIKPSYGAVKAYISLLNTPLWQQTQTESLSTLDMQRVIQAHFLNNGVYIPIEDISEVSVEQSASHLNGATKWFSIWIPFHFNIPLVGEKVYEWSLTMK